MIEQLFGSKTRVKLLRLFFSNPNRSFYVREITRKIDEQINSVRRELANLLSMGLITSDSTNNKLYYEVNQSYEHYAALESMFSERVGIVPRIAQELPQAALAHNVDTATNTETIPRNESTVLPVQEFSVQLPEAAQWMAIGVVVGVAYSGVYTRDEISPVDILIIGDAPIRKVESVILTLEKEKDRELRYAVMESHEWLYRRQVRDKFWQQFMAAKKEVLLDKDNYFKK